MPPGQERRLPTDVCAVIYGSAPEPLLGAARRAVTEAAPAPALVLDAADLGAAARVAGATGRSWMWLLEAGTVPAPQALDRLLAVAGEDPQAVLLSSKVVDAEGEMCLDGTLRHEVFEKERSVRAAARGLVQLRTAGHGSVLVSNAAWVRCGGPRLDLPPGLSMFEWSARLLRRWEDAGYLVPDSLAVRRLDPAPAPGLWGRARILSGPGWTPTEKLWEGFLLSQDVGARLRRRLKGGRELAPQGAGRHAGRGG